MKINVKKIGKITGAACAATGVVAVSALVASGAAIGAVAEGFKAAGNTMKKILADQERESENVVDSDPEVIAEAL